MGKKVPNEEVVDERRWFCANVGDKRVQLRVWVRRTDLEKFGSPCSEGVETESRSQSLWASAYDKGWEARITLHK